MWLSLFFKKIWPCANSFMLKYNRFILKYQSSLAGLIQIIFFQHQLPGCFMDTHKQSMTVVVPPPTISIGRCTASEPRCSIKVSQRIVPLIYLSSVKLLNALSKGNYHHCTLWPWILQVHCTSCEGILCPNTTANQYHWLKFGIMERHSNSSSIAVDLVVLAPSSS